MPIVPVVSIGGQEQYLFLSRGEWLARLLRLDKLLRLKTAPIIVGIPFGLTSGDMLSLPLPAKIVTRVLEPIRLDKEFGPVPVIDEVDRAIRARMQAALDELARERTVSS